MGCAQAAATRRWTTCRARGSCGEGAGRRCWWVGQGSVQGCVMVEEAKCEDVGKIRNNLFAEGCVGLLCWVGVCLARRFFCG